MLIFAASIMRRVLQNRTNHLLCDLAEAVGNFPSCRSGKRKWSSRRRRSYMARTCSLEHHVLVWVFHLRIETSSLPIKFAVSKAGHNWTSWGISMLTVKNANTAWPVSSLHRKPAWEILYRIRSWLHLSNSTLTLHDSKMPDWISSRGVRRRMIDRMIDHMERKMVLTAKMTSPKHTNRTDLRGCGHRANDQ